MKMCHLRAKAFALYDSQEHSLHQHTVLCSVWPVSHRLSINPYSDTNHTLCCIPFLGISAKLRSFLLTFLQFFIIHLHMIQQFHVVDIILVFSDTQSKEFYIQKLHCFFLEPKVRPCLQNSVSQNLMFFAHNVAKSRIQVIKIFNNNSVHLIICV